MKMNPILFTLSLMVATHVASATSISVSVSPASGGSSPAVAAAAVNSAESAVYNWSASTVFAYQPPDSTASPTSIAAAASSTGGQPRLPQAPAPDGGSTILLFGAALCGVSLMVRRLKA
jgi:hypothetical protein